MHSGWKIPKQVQQNKEILQEFSQSSPHQGASLIHSQFPYGEWSLPPTHLGCKWPHRPQCGSAALASTSRPPHMASQGRKCCSPARQTHRSWRSKPPASRTTARPNLEEEGGEGREGGREVREVTLYEIVPPTNKRMRVRAVEGSKPSKSEKNWASGYLDNVSMAIVAKGAGLTV